MKRLLCLLVLLLVVGSVGAPFYAVGKPISKSVDTLAKSVTVSKYSGTFKTEPFGIYSPTMVDRENSTEYLWTLTSRPASNVFSLKVTFTNSHCSYQPALTQAEIDEGIIRPENVVGSYAVISDSNIFGNTGKLAHIYRPLVIDAKGKTIWGILLIEDNILTVTVDSKWLDSATYPVIVDPNIGFEGVGGTQDSASLNGADRALAQRLTVPAAGIYPTLINGYASIITAAKGAIWDTDSARTILKTGGTATWAGAASWKTMTVTGYQTPVGVHNYYFGFVVSGPLYVFYDADAPSLAIVDLTNSYAVPATMTADGTTYARKYSLFVTYDSVPTITSSVIAMDDTDNLYAMKGYYTFTTVINDVDGATDIKAISVRGAQGASVRWMVNATTLDGAPAYAIGSGSTVIDLDAAGCSFTENVNDGTLVLSIRFEWDATNEADCELEVWARDVLGASVGWTTVQTNYFDVISRLVTMDFTGNVTSTTINSPVEISGKVRYALGPAYVNASTSYPLDAQFTAVKIADDESTVQATDATIVNGFFNLTVTTPGSLGTVYYYAYLDLVPDYTDDYAVDADYVAVSISPAFGIVSQIPQGFTFFGANITQVYLTITAFTVWFTDSATALIGMVAGVLTLIVYISGEIINWTARMANFFVDLITFISSIFSGTVGGHNIWTEFNIAAWIDFIPLVAFIIWFGGIPGRAKRAGSSDVEVLLRDLQVASWIIGEVWNWTFTVFNFVANMIMSFIGVFIP